MIPPGHFSIGMVFGFIILLIFIKFKIVSRKVLLYAPFIMTACGFFALIPDFPLWYQGLGELDHENTHTPISNVFFFHLFIDQIDNNGPQLVKDFDDNLAYFIIVLMYNLSFYIYIKYIKTISFK